MAENKLRVPKGATKSKKRLGRGPASGTGCTAGRGNKGQGARSGGGVRPGFEGGQMPLYRRIARRGFSNALFKTRYIAINLDDLEVFKDGDTISVETLVAKGLIKKSETNVKLLGRGECSKKYSVEIEKVSGQAKDKIEKAGGSVKEYTIVEKPGKFRKKGDETVHPAKANKKIESSAGEKDASKAISEEIKKTETTILQDTEVKEADAAEITAPTEEESDGDK